MQLNLFKKFICKVYSEGKRLQKHDILGNELTSRKYTHMQLLSKIIAFLYIVFIHSGFSTDFAGYIISFLAIFIGLFSTILISMYDRKDELYTRYARADKVKKETIKKIRNYLVQFTGLTSYSILLSLVLVVLLLLVLLIPNINIDTSKYVLITNLDDLNCTTVYTFLKISALTIHRFLVIDNLLTFFYITIYSTSSYFAFLQTEYNELKFEDD
ncbi:hypothetical protein CAP35_13130 [Chitinophagaceae bacterium IBVUCB1]|nr:hypothetical protein CAP35_13130 [Chitinophagaceae bacterium IBVUCB1]